MDFFYSNVFQFMVLCQNIQTALSRMTLSIGDIRNPPEFSGKLLPLLTALVSLIAANFRLIKRVRP